MSSLSELPAPAAAHGRRGTEALAALALLLLAACTPAHDWRQVRSADGAVGALFPCKPQLHERRVVLAGQPVKLALLACEAGGQTWGLAEADLADPTRLAPVLDALAQSAGDNLGAAAPVVEPLQVPGATPHAGSRRLRLDGRRPDGRAVRMQLAVFVRGTHVYQASVLGEQLPAEAAQTFFDSLRAGS